MTTVDEATLAAWVDGELPPEQAAQLATAVAADAALAARAARLRAQRERLRGAFAADDPVPERLQQAAAALADRLAEAGAPAPVVSLEAARRAARAPAAAARGATPGASRRAAAWAPWWGLAASLLLGVALGLGLRPPAERPGGGDAAWFVTGAEGRLIAGGALAGALQRTLASEPAGAIAVQLSFVGHDGGWCRSFAAGRVAGLACRSGEDWALQMLTSAEPAAPGALRQAASSLPPELLQAVDRLAAAPPVDAAAERAARDAGWRR